MSRNKWKPINLFIDTNIFLRFYEYSTDDVNNLKEIVKLIYAKRIHLYLPDQIKNEFLRKREVAINTTLKSFKEYRMPSSKIPSLMEHFFEDIKSYHEAIKNLQSTHDKLLEGAMKGAYSQQLPPDNLFYELSEAAHNIPLKSHVKEAAQWRTLIGDPPGKSDHLGDRLIWETLLEAVPESLDLHVVTDDNDYYSILKEDEPHPFLDKEWQEKKNSKLFTYKTLASFFSEFFPKIKIPIDSEKTIAINMLIDSSTFSNTHKAIKRINPFISKLTDLEQDALVEAGLTNDQIWGIYSDPDVQHFYSTILNACRTRYLKRKIEEVEDRFGLYNSNEES